MGHGRGKSCSSLEFYLPAVHSACVAEYRHDDNAPSHVVLDTYNIHNGDFTRNTNVAHVPGIKRGALNYNGISDYLNTTHHWQELWRKAFTICFWLRILDGKPSDSDEILGIRKSTTPYNDVGIYIQSTSGIPRFYYAANSTWANSISLNFGFSFISGANPWKMMSAKVWQSSPTEVTAKLYLNGHPSGSSQTKPQVMTNFTTSTSLFVGNVNYAGIPMPAEYVTGDYDEVCLFDRALSDEEILYIYNFGRGKEL